MSAETLLAGNGGYYEESMNFQLNPLDSLWAFLHNARQFFPVPEKLASNTMLVTPSQAMKARLLLLMQWLKKPEQKQRSADEIRLLGREMRGLSLYYHPLCPLCIRTRRVIYQLNIPLELRDVCRSQVYRDDLLAGVGQLCTPCLRIVEAGQVRWIRGADNIINYLLQRFGVDESASQAA